MHANCSNDSESVREFLRQLEEMSDTAMIPAVVMLVIFSVVGLVGNILVLVVYSKKIKIRPTKVLIMTIATFDLVANVGAIPSEINIMMDSWTFSQPWVCKGKVLLGAFTTVGGAISLCVVAAIRYRKVCRPYDWQFTIRQAVIASILTAFISFLVAIPYIIIYGVRTRATTCPNIHGHECFASDYYVSTIWTFLNEILYIVLYIILSVSMVVLYTLIGRMAWKHRNLHGVPRAVTVATTNNNPSCEGMSSSDSEPIVSFDTEAKPQTTKWPSRIKSDIFRRASSKNVDEKIEEEPTSFTNKINNMATSDTENQPNSNLGAGSSNNLDLVELKVEELAEKVENNEEFQGNEPTRNSSGDLERSCYLAVSQKNKHIKNEQDMPKKSPQGAIKTKSKSAPIAKGERNRRRFGRMTAMLIIISAIFVLGYLPFLGLTVVRTRFPMTYANLNMAELVAFNLFYRLYFLNSAVNPIVYSFCDLNFRRECYRLLTCKSRSYK